METGKRLTLVGDWGSANFTRMCVWIASHLYRRRGRSCLSSVWNSEVWMDSMADLVSGRADVAVFTPPAFARLALEGRPPFESPAPNLRGLGVIPHNDGVICVARRGLGISNLSELQGRTGLRIGTPPDDGYSFLGQLVNEVLAAHEVDLEKACTNGGFHYTSVWPGDVADALAKRQVDLLVNEAWMIPQLWQVLDSGDYYYISLNAAVIRDVQEQYGIRERLVPAGYFPHQESDISTIDFSDWLIATTEALDDDIAYEIASILVEERESFERLYRAFPLKNSPLQYPIVPGMVPHGTQLPLHPGAARYYEERGYL